MGVLDDAIREHLELRRKHGAPEEELRRLEEEALGPARPEPAPEPEEEILSGGDEPAEAAEWVPEESPEATLEESTEAAHGAPSGAGPDKASADEDRPESPGVVASAPFDLDALPTDVDSGGAPQEPFAEESAPAIPRDVEAAEPLPDAEPPAEVDEPVPDRVEEQPGHAPDYPPEETGDREAAASAFAEPGPAERGHGGFGEVELEETHQEAARSGFAQVDPDERDSDAGASGFESVEPAERDLDAAAAAEAEPDEGEAQRSGGRVEETPDFAEDSPEHDRLWFEQGRPRDYDFD
jgi:hypothetical protein